MLILKTTLVRIDQFIKLVYIHLVTKSLSDFDNLISGII